MLPYINNFEVHNMSCVCKTLTELNQCIFQRSIYMSLPKNFWNLEVLLENIIHGKKNFQLVSNELFQWVSESYIKKEEIFLFILLEINLLVANFIFFFHCFLKVPAERGRGVVSNQELYSLSRLYTFKLIWIKKKMKKNHWIKEIW